jgi:hypothetical protein
MYKSITNICALLFEPKSDLPLLYNLSVIINYPNYIYQFLLNGFFNFSPNFIHRYCFCNDKSSFLITKKLLGELA